MADRHIPTEDEVLSWMQKYSNWGRWGPDDEQGTLNLITPAKRAQAASLVREGISVSASRPIIPELTTDMIGTPPLHYMINSGDASPDKGPGGASDFLGMAFHGYTITHLDSLCHMFWDGKMYNGKPASSVGVQKKATAGGVENAKDGVITRGVLLDIAALKGKEWLDAGEGVFPDELEAAEEAAGVKVEEGDCLMVRTGWFKKRMVEGPHHNTDRPGLHAACIPYLYERGVSILHADAAQDVGPTPGYPITGLPIHRVGIPHMGLWLIDCGNCEEVAEVANRLNRYEFMFIMAPLRFNGATGSPINPLAVF